MVTCSYDDYDPEQYAGSQIPVLVIGTKADLADAVREKSFSRVSAIAEECRADELNIVRYIMSPADILVMSIQINILTL